MPLPERVRRGVPDRLRFSVRLRGLALSAGLIPPRIMHSEAEAALLARLCAGLRTVVEIGVYEGSSSVVLARALEPEATLHLIDPYTEEALHPGWRGVPNATRRVVERAAGEEGPRLVWHVALSADVAASWTEPVDLVFVDGDHTEVGVQLDWDVWNEHVSTGGLVVFHDARSTQAGGAGLGPPSRLVDRLFRGPEPELPGWRIAGEADSAVAVERLA